MFKPLFNRVLVEPKIISNETKSGLIVTIDETDQMPVDSGTVVNVGFEVKYVKVGDKIMFHQFNQVSKEIEGKKYLIIKEEDILGII